MRRDREAPQVRTATAVTGSLDVFASVSSTKALMAQARAVKRDSLQVLRMGARYLGHVIRLWVTACIIGVVIIGVLIFAFLENTSRLRSFRFTSVVESTGTKEAPQAKQGGTYRRVVQGRPMVMQNCRDRTP